MQSCDAEINNASVCTENYYLCLNLVSATYLEEQHKVDLGFHILRYIVFCPEKCKDYLHNSSTSAVQILMQARQVNCDLSKQIHRRGLRLEGTSEDHVVQPFMERQTWVRLPSTLSCLILDATTDGNSTSSSDYLFSL